MGYIGQAPANKAVKTADIEDSAITAAKIADGTVVAGELASDSVTTVKILNANVTTAKLAADAIDSTKLADDAVGAEHIADNAVGLAALASGTDGNVISYDASGNPVAIATGSDGQVLTSAGAGQPPAFEAAAGFDVTSITGATALGATPADTDEFVLSDAGVLKRVDYSYIKGEQNKPYFLANRSGHQTGVSANTWTTIIHNSETVDSENTYDSSTGIWTPSVAGYYQIDLIATAIPDADVTQMMVAIKHSAWGDPRWIHFLKLGSANINRWGGALSGIVYMNGSTTVESRIYVVGQDAEIHGEYQYTQFGGYLIAST